jgi:HAD superfamily hydrolase (TIGR01509 family)
MTRAIIFDCYGVLVTDGLLPFIDKYFDGHIKNKQQALALIADVDRGQLSQTDFNHQLATLAGLSEVAVESEILQHRPNQPLLDYIKISLKPRYKIGVLSNAGSNRLNELLGDDHVSLFDSVTLSYESGFIKPDPGAFATAANRLGVKPSGCIFIDDQARHCAGARTIGMPAILYRSFDQMKNDLGQLLDNN